MFSGFGEPCAGPQPHYTERLSLIPIGPELADELFRLHQDPGITHWYGPWTVDDACERVAAMGRAWQVDGVHKWLAYDRATDTLVGRGGLSYTAEHRLEIGWAVRESLWGRGYATEIGRAGLDFAFGELGASEVISFTETHNRRSRAVMERLGSGTTGTSRTAVSRSCSTSSEPTSSRARYCRGRREAPRLRRRAPAAPAATTCMQH
ncbi:GNAT family N-acetyltransferase [Amycolatopsis sp. NPDC005232]|uniref:GNAT family N-acetyltransferase n=1 Tax=Amycolatopsis sp. NPDC005232 TaxID=3157027 RepID=UPI0033B4B6B4